MLQTSSSFSNVRLSVSQLMLGDQHINFHGRLCKTFNIAAVQSVIYLQHTFLFVVSKMAVKTQKESYIFTLISQINDKSMAGVSSVGRAGAHI